jgi:hypothetical protein
MLIDFSSAALLSGGDAVPGSGAMTLSSRTNENVLTAYGEDALSNNSAPGPVVGTQLHGTVGGHAVTWWICIGIVLVVIKFLAEKGGDAGEFKNVRVGFFNIMVITLSAVVGLTLLKWVFGYYTIPGISAVIEAA